MEPQALLTAFALLPFGVAALGLLFRLAYGKCLEPITLHNMAPPQALAIVGDFVLAGNDTDFGFPSGFFIIPRFDRLDEQLAKGSITVKEELLRGNSGFLMLLRGLYYWAVQAMARIASSGEGIGCFMAVLVGSFMLVPAPFLLYAGIAEFALRLAFRSNVKLTAEVVPGTADTRVFVVLRGLSALSTGAELTNVFRSASLPTRFHPLLRMAPAPTAPKAA